MEFCNVNPILESNDIEASVDFYVSKLGATEHFIWGEPTEYGSVFFGESMLHFQLVDSPAHNNWHAVFVTVDGIEDYYDQICKNGVEIVSELSERCWHFNEFRIRDNMGHVLRFGEAMEDAPVDE